VLTGLADGLAQEEQRYAWPDGRTIRPNCWVPRSGRLLAWSRAHRTDSAV